MTISRTSRLLPTSTTNWCKNLHIIPEIAYYDSGDDVDYRSSTNRRGDDEWGGFLRVQYNWGG